MENLELETDNSLHAQWTAVKSLVEELEFDLVKNQKGVVAAGVRLRRGLRALRKQVTFLIKETTAQDNAKKAERVAKKKAAA